MSQKTLKFKIKGTVPLILHNGQTADPLNPHSKSIAEIVGKAKKTDAGQLELARREWYAGLYVANGEPCLPYQMIESGLVAGAKREKRGAAAKAGIIVDTNVRLEYDGPHSPDELWKDETFRLRVPVRVGQARVMRTRPFFPEWGAELNLCYFPDILNAGDIRNFLVTLGQLIGLGDWRPRFGRFEVVQ